MVSHDEIGKSKKMNDSWIKLYRRLAEWEWYRNGNTFRLFIHLLLNANHISKRWQGIDIQPGQVITGRKKLSDDLGLSEREIRTSLNHLKTTNEIAIQTTNKFSIVTICKWEDYQSTNTIERPAERPTTSHPSDQQTTTPKEYKNIRKEEDIYSASVPDTGHTQPDFILTKKKRKLSGKRLETFLVFWEKFNYKKGKAEAADSWLDIPQLTNSICEQIFKAAEIEASRRVKLIEKGLTPKMAQGWITARRWEDEDLQSIQKLRNEKLNRPIYDPELR